jgi:hypothetical protein
MRNERSSMIQHVRSTLPIIREKPTPTTTTTRILNITATTTTTTTTTMTRMATTSKTPSICTNHKIPIGKTDCQQTTTIDRTEMQLTPTHKCVATGAMCTTAVPFNALVARCSVFLLHTTECHCHQSNKPRHQQTNIASITPAAAAATTTIVFGWRARV